MLRQPTWHRVWSEWQANREIRRLAHLPYQGEGEPFRVGMIGCGRVARRHAYGYLKTGRAILVCCSDPATKQREKFRKRFGIAQAFADHDEMLGEGQLDLISICSPPRFHKAAVLAAAKAGVRAILCEKPLGLDLAEVDEMIDVCKQRGVLLATGHQRRFGEQHVMARQLLEQGIIGKIRLIRLECPRDILRAGIHSADMLLHYGGPARHVNASLSDGKGGAAKPAAQASPTAEAGDKESTIFVEMESGVAAVLRVENRGGLDARICFLGDQGTMEVWWDGGLRYRRSNDATWTVPPLKLNPYLVEFQKEQEALMNALSHKSPPPVRGEDGRNSLELILAILFSNEQGRQITLPLRSESLVKVAGVQAA